MKNKIILIFGGTGSFGSAFLKKIINTSVKEIRIFSRDEKKQDDMRKKFSNKKIKFLLGDIRNASSVFRACKNVDYVFNAAALKQVPSCEFYPMEAVKTNIHGVENVIKASIKNNVKKVICLSTDKAVYPINAMGISKAMMEKVMIAESRNLSPRQTTICGTRYGNVIASRGSVIELFNNQILANKEITITDPNMTRFMLTLEDAVDLVMYAFRQGKNGEIYVRKAPAATVQDIAGAIIKIYGKDNYPIKVIGTRHGEKLYESLLSKEELSFAKDLGKYYCLIPDRRDLNYEKFYEKGTKDLNIDSDYNSHNTTRLSVDEIVSLLKKSKFVKNLLDKKK